jgi:hypothetical protein
VVEGVLLAHLPAHLPEAAEGEEEGLLPAAWEEGAVEEEAWL